MKLSKIKSIKIGDIILDCPVILAPMSGVTDLPFRKLVKFFGCPLVVSEMIASRAMIIQTRQSMLKIAKEKDSYPQSIQLAGCDPQVMSEAAKMNEDMGADIIDINFGCPVKKVVGGNAGSALMNKKHQDLALQILEAMVKAVRIPVTLKMRMGWDFDSLNAPELAKLAEEIGIKMITIHGRTRSQLYRGNADWSFISKVKDQVKIPVIVNGDIKNYDDVDKALELSRADGIMIGRACYGKPWLINHIMNYLATGERKEPPKAEEMFFTIKNHVEEMIEHYGEEIAICIMCKHLGWYSNGLYNAVKFRQKLHSTNNIQEVRDLMERYFVDQASLDEDIVLDTDKNLTESIVDRTVVGSFSG